MITQHDIAWIKSNRKEVTHNRTVPITLIGKTETGRHPITDEPITEEVTESTVAVVVEISSAFKLDRDLIDGVEVEEGDIWIDIDIDDLPIPAKDVISVEYGDDDDDYTIMAKDNAGIGATNRVIMVGRLTG